MPFTLTEVVDGHRWSWRVAGIAATTHTVDTDGDGCRVGFGVPFVAAPYLMVCRLALARIDKARTC